jgi:hypothetical protein
MAFPQENKQKPLLPIGKGGFSCCKTKTNSSAGGSQKL